MIPTSATSPANTPTPPSAMIGIASLILEGRALSDDDFVPSAMGYGDKGVSARLSSSGSHYNTTHNSTGNTFPLQAMDSDPTLQHFQRLRQKLGQLRQSSPGTSRDNLAEQEVVVGPSGSAMSAARNADDSDDGELNQFVQRKPKSSHQAPDNNLLYTLQSLASTCLRTTPRSFSRNRDVAAPDVWLHSTSSHAASMKTFAIPSSSHAIIGNTSASSSTSSSVGHSHQAMYQQKIAKIQQQQLNRGEKIASPKQGPHCDQFLKKLGLGKGEVSEGEEHICDMANLNEICYRWHIHCRQIEVIMSRCDPICIEVYLGPENYEILLEQWIIQRGEKSETPNMTLQSLCNAIRSQLYFSQITAWSDLIRKTGSYDKEIQENGRIKTPTNGALMQKKPRLDIFYRIKAYDSTACFNAKPNVHNFPTIIISENCTISVCLKSLPRLPGGIPKIGDFLGSHPAVPSSMISVVNDSGEEQSPGRDEAMILDDRLNLPCQEKGKHKCVFDEEDGSSDTVGDGSCSSGMSHREKQLLKYRKRMMKRDRKSKKAIDLPNAEQCQPMQLEEKRIIEDNSHHCLDSINNLQAMHEFGSINSINSIRPPLYQTTTIVTEAVQTNTVEMISIGTQTADFPMLYPSCGSCGHNMQLVCWNCEKNPQSGVHANNSSLEANEPAKLGKGDILLQAIQRTPQRKSQDVGNNNNSPDSRASLNPNLSNCQLCKRQKTGHHYAANENGLINGNSYVRESDSSKAMFNRSSSPSETQRLYSSSGHQLKDNKYPCGKCGCIQPLTLHLEHNCDASIQDTDSLPNGKCVPSPVNSNTDLLLTDDLSAQFKTPKANVSAKNQLKPNVLPIGQSDKFFKSLPKVNLSNIFCSPSSPIPITSPDTFRFDNETPDIPVQKSNSAPTLPNSPSLSPRFLKQAAIYKRRSRHLSDRSSERSSFGSDEQFSDEDLDSVYSPASSPVKNKTFRCNSFGKKPLLGNLEESLLQKRFTPKTQVAGFKVLLGASGAYCPTQLTIPAAAYFFELSGQTLSTPYVCEIRLSRKGYTIPRTGTVQATLLNPLGTVVRMFVVPYDFRDMPPMSQTFIRQRILAINSEAESLAEKHNSSNQLPSSSGYLQSDTTFTDHMHSLRYSIHLRFQTSRSGRLALHTDIRFLISRRTDCDTAAAHAKGALESPNDLRVITITPEHPKYSARQENPNKI